MTSRAVDAVVAPDEQIFEFKFDVNVLARAMATGLVS